MSSISSLFVTRLYHAKLSELGKPVDPQELDGACLSIAEDDEAGQEWCEREGFPGYTSYASLTDLPWRFPIFKDLVAELDKHIAAFATDACFDLDGRALKLEDIWINILPEGGIHTSHIHPHSVISGTTYVAMPKDASAIKFEDPRHAMMMAAPGRTAKARRELRTFVYEKPKVGDVLLWGSRRRRNFSRMTSSLVLFAGHPRPKGGNETADNARGFVPKPLLCNFRPKGGSCRATDNDIDRLSEVRRDMICYILLSLFSIFSGFVVILHGFTQCN